MSNGTRLHLLVGLAGSGKTTFLAALWHVVESGELATELTLTALHGDRSHVNSIRESWLACEKVHRTRLQDKHEIRMKLARGDSTSPDEFIFPDMSGEAFGLAWKDRRWPRDFDDLVRSAHGLLLFVHPDVVEATPIEVAEAVHEELADLDPPSLDEETPPDVPWNAELCPTQVQLVELLQFIAARRSSTVPLRTAIVVSAWDLVSRQRVEPDEWLELRLPLLAQFLRSNSRKYEVGVFGVSAQGGRLDDESERTRLAKSIHHSERVLVRHAGDDSHDLTKLLAWATE